MKKSYNKPDILFESFALSVDIAGGCTALINSFIAGTCGVEFGPGESLFVEGVTGCNVLVEDTGEYDGLCYHVPVAENKLFNS